MKDRLYLNTHDSNKVEVAKEMGLGIELDDYLFFNDKYCKDIDEEKKNVLFNKCLKMIKGFDKLILNGGKIYYGK